MEDSDEAQRFTVNVSVFDGIEGEWTLLEFIEFIKSKIPNEYRNTAIVDIKYDYYLGSTFSISYRREETDEELFRRMEYNYAYAREQQEKKRSWYKVWKAKFEK